MGDQEILVERLSGHLSKAASLRARSRAKPKLATAREGLREWQAARLARTHADLLRSPHFGSAAEFFLSDVYSPKDAGRRDEQIERVVPMMTKVIPAGGLEIVADALELDALTEDLDAAMLDVLKSGAARLGPASYGRAYRQVGRRADRERQIELIRDLGFALERLAKAPFIRSALAVMRRPAKIAGLGDLQSFLERGYTAFRKLGSAEEFLEIVTSREQALLEALFAGDDTLLSG
jgi:hypothetical protein